MLGNNPTGESFSFPTLHEQLAAGKQKKKGETGTTKSMHSLGQSSESCEMVLTSRHRFEIVSAICASFEALLLLVVGRSFSLFLICCCCCFLCSRNEHKMN